MKRIIKISTGFIASLVMIGSLAACGSAKTSSTSPGTDTSTSSSSEDTTPSYLIPKKAKLTGKSMGNAFFKKGTIKNYYTSNYQTAETLVGNFQVEILSVESKGKDGYLGTDLTYKVTNETKDPVSVDSESLKIYTSEDGDPYTWGMFDPTNGTVEQTPEEGFIQPGESMTFKVPLDYTLDDDSNYNAPHKHTFTIAISNAYGVGNSQSKPLSDGIPNWPDDGTSSLGPAPTTVYANVDFN